MALMRRLNPTASLLKSDAFCVRHEYVFSLPCLLNVNMGALDLSRTEAQERRYRTANTLGCTGLCSALCYVCDMGHSVFHVYSWSLI